MINSSCNDLQETSRSQIVKRQQSIRGVEMTEDWKMAIEVTAVYVCQLGGILWIQLFPTCSEASVVKRIRQMCSCVWVDKAQDSIVVLLHCTLKLSKSLCEVFFSD